jgi:uncharacterized phosphosugar-binding protein
MTEPSLPAAERYYHDAMARLQHLLDSQRPALDRAAALCTEAIASEGLVHLFGCGHSRMLCEEMTPRQGCFVGWHTIVELALSFHNLIVGPNGLRQSLHLEKTPGYAEQILRNFAFGPKDVLIVISTSGIREVIVEMAEGAHRRGLKVIGVVSRAHSDQAKPAHASGKKLIDVADVILDNGAPVGDCLLELDGLANKTGPFSTLGGALVMNCCAARSRSASSIGVSSRCSCRVTSSSAVAASRSNWSISTLSMHGAWAHCMRAKGIELR